MKYALGSLLLAGGLVLSFGVAYADVLMLSDKKDIQQKSIGGYRHDEY
jgi:hypothetical protein